MKKKALSLFSALCMTLSLPASGANAADFRDVPSDAYYYDAVEWALNFEPQITQGTSEESFSPDSTCKRCEVVTFLWRAFGAERITGENNFTDVAATDYFYDAVLWAAENGIAAGTDETHFSPDAPCTREQVAAFLWRACGKPGTQMQVSPFADVLDKEAYSFTPILWASENGITKGASENAFSPNALCTRAQIVTFLYRALAKPLTPVESADNFTFEPKVASQYLAEIFGEQKVEAWFNLVDAVMAGEDTFACPNQETYDWVMGQFPNKCFPVLTELIDYAYNQEHSVDNGVASFTYRVSREEAAAKISEFSEFVEDILNEAMKPDYSDFEKALSLFLYFRENYTYDYAAAEDVENGEGFYTNSYRLLTGKTGVCHEISNAYSYLLMQAGVDAATVMGGNHEWSYIRLNGKNYHIDPTYALNFEPGDLRYFLMTDSERCEDGFDKERFVYCSNYSQEHPHPNYAADDETFTALRLGCFDSIDYEKQVLSYLISADFGEQWVETFDYKGY